MPYLPFSGHDKNFPKIIKVILNYFNFNACHQVQFQTNLMNKLDRGKLKIVEFEPKNDQYPSFWVKH